MSDIQHIRNTLSLIEDEARQARNRQSDLDNQGLDMALLFNLIVKLTKIVREEIVR